MARKKPFSLLRNLRFIAFLVVVYALWHLVQAFVFNQSNWPTDGIILEFVENDAPFNPSQSPLIAYVDFDGGKHLVIPENALDTETLSVGQKVWIVYSIDNPEHMRLDTPLGVWGTGSIWLVLGLAPLIILSVLISIFGKGKPNRSPHQRAKPTRSIEAVHLLGHDVDASDRDAPVVRRMR